MQLHQTWDGLQRTGRYLVLFNGVRLGPAVGEDDSGLALAAPAVARTLHVTVETGATIVLAGSLLCGLAVGLAGWWRCARTASARWLGAGAYLVFGWLTLQFGDTYSIATTLVLGLVPWLLLAWRRDLGPRAWAALLLACGLVVGAGQLVRTAAGAPVVALAITLVLTSKARWVHRLALVCTLLVGLALPGVPFRAALARRDAYLAGVLENYQAPTGTHPVWHSIYIGFGFLTNDKGFVYNDGVAARRVAAIDPGARYISPRYEAVARRLVLDLVRHDPWFVVKSDAAKVGLLGFYFVVFANVGIAAALARRKPWRLDLALAAGLTAAALPGILVVPDFRYVFGFTTLAALFGLTSLDFALDAGWPGWLGRLGRLSRSRSPVGRAEVAR